MTKRNANVDLFRIIATFLVILLHILGQGGILNASSPYGALYWITWFLEIGALCAVNCFALISGFIMVNKSVKLKTIVSTWFQVLFYSLLITVLIFFLMPETGSIRALVNSLFPILGNQWWYISSYFALFFFIPLLNKAIENLSQRTFKRLLIVILIGICCLDCVFPSDPFLLNSGYSAVWLMLVYLFGAYIKKYDLAGKITASKSLLGYFAAITLTFLSKFGISYLTKLIFGQSKYENLLVTYNSITILFASIFLFLFCLNLKIGERASKIILFLSPATLGVYLIHAHPLIFNHLLYNSFVPLANKPLVILLLAVFGGAFIIFTICSLIDLLRIRLFRLIKVNALSEAVENKTKRII